MALPQSPSPSHKKQKPLGTFRSRLLVILIMRSANIYSPADGLKSSLTPMTDTYETAVGQVILTVTINQL